MRLYQLTGIVLIVICMAACGNAEKPKHHKENIVVYHTIGEPDGMHPVNDNSGPRAEIITYTQVFLIMTDIKNNQPLPHLAAALPEVSSDGKEYSYTLKTDMKWDDGSV